jgi:uncharacterized protein (UPF0335 family)
MAEAAITMDEITGASQTALTGFVREIEDLHAQRKELNTTITGVYERLKSAGFVPAIVREMVKERGMKRDARNARYQLLDNYRRALGLLADLPLGKAAMAEAERALNDSGKTAAKPKMFAEQPLGPAPKRRGRPRRVLFDREHPHGFPSDA